MAWSIDMVAEFQRWLESLDQDTYDGVLATADILREEGPSLGRPLVGMVKVSQFSNMKERVRLLLAG